MMDVSCADEEATAEVLIRRCPTLGSTEAADRVLAVEAHDMLTPYVGFPASSCRPRSTSATTLPARACLVLS
jgi:hypothetical protein